MSERGTAIFTSFWTGGAGSVSLAVAGTGGDDCATGATGAGTNSGATGAGCACVGVSVGAGVTPSRAHPTRRDVPRKRMSSQRETVPTSLYDPETFPLVLWVLQFINHGNGVILVGNLAFAGFV